MSELGTNVGYELGFRYGRVIGKILVAVYGIPIGTCNSMLIGYLEGFIYGDMDDKCVCLFLYRVCINVILVIFSTRVFVNICVGV